MPIRIQIRIFYREWGIQCGVVDLEDFYQIIGGEISFFEEFEIIIPIWRDVGGP